MVLARCLVLSPRNHGIRRSRQAPASHGATSGRRRRGGPTPGTGRPAWNGGGLRLSACWSRPSPASSCCEARRRRWINRSRPGSRHPWP